MKTVLGNRSTKRAVFGLMGPMLSWVIALVIGAAWAQDDPPPPPDPSPPPDPHRPPEPGTGDFDWMQFKNGEWLKGDIKELHEFSFVFDSDKLDTLNLDFDDIQTVISPRVNTITLRDMTVLEGHIRIDGDTVTVTTDAGEQKYTRSQLLSLIPGTQHELNFWSGKLSLGADLERGNTQNVDLSLFAQLQRRTPRSRLNLSYNGAFGRLDGATNTNNHHGTATYDYYVSDRIYVRPAGVDLFKDEFQNIDYRVIPFAGAGYDIFDSSDLYWTAAGGVGYQILKYDDPLPGEPEEDRSAALLAGTNLTWKATSDIDFGFEYVIVVPVDDAGKNHFRVTLSGSFDLFRNFDLDARLIWERNNDPATLSDGSTPTKDDIRLHLGIGWNF